MIKNICKKEESGIYGDKFIECIGFISILFHIMVSLFSLVVNYRYRVFILGDWQYKMTLPHTVHRCQTHKGNVSTPSELEKMAFSAVGKLSTMDM